MGVPGPVSQMWAVSSYVIRQKLRGTETVSARPDAGAFASLQSGLRWLRKDPVSRARLEEAVDPGGVLPRGRGMRRSDGKHPRRRAADASADRRDRQGLIARKKYIYLCTNALLLSERLHEFHSQQISVLLGAHGRTARAPRFRRLPRRHLRQSRRGNPHGIAARLPRDDEYHAFRRHRSRSPSASFSTT